MYYTYYYLLCIYYVFRIFVPCGYERVLTGDTTRPGIQDGVLLYESSGKLRFDCIETRATGSDELVELTYRLAI